MNTHRQFIISVLLLAGIVSFHPTRAAESYDNCAGFIDTIPATISAQGVWCLRHDLSTAIASGSAITIAANNVVIDCNDFKLGGLAGGNGSDAIGIQASNKQNAAIRHCNIRGFEVGIDLDGGAGHLVEDNRLDNNLKIGISVAGDNNLVQRNRVYDTGGYTGSSEAIGIWAAANLIDNTVSGLFDYLPNGSLTGIYENGGNTQVRGNFVSGYNMAATGPEGGTVSYAFGIYPSSTFTTIANNSVFGPGGGAYGIGSDAASSIYCIGNVVVGFVSSIHNCRTVNDSGNDTNIAINSP